MTSFAKNFVYPDKRAIELKPDYAQAHNNLGVALMNKGNTNEAISHFKMAIELKPDYAQAQKNLETALRSVEVQDLF